jgi:hypothetical protein
MDKEVVAQDSVTGREGEAFDGHTLPDWVKLRAAVVELIEGRFGPSRALVSKVASIDNSRHLITLGNQHQYSTRTGFRHRYGSTPRLLQERRRLVPADSQEARDAKAVEYVSALLADIARVGGSAGIRNVQEASGLLEDLANAILETRTRVEDLRGEE